MALDEICLSYLEKLIIIKPVYGWGWTRIDAPEIPVPSEINGVPYPFHCRIKDFFRFKNELRGSVGSIEEAGCIYHGLWIIFYTRTVGVFNFTGDLPYCNLQIGSQIPDLPGEWPEFTFGRPIINGYAFVGESLKHVEEFDAKLFSRNKF